MKKMLETKLKGSPFSGAEVIGNMMVAFEKEVRSSLAARSHLTISASLNQSLMAQWSNIALNSVVLARVTLV